MIYPLPPQFSQAPFELKLNKPLSTLFSLANKALIMSNTLVYVATFDLELIPTLSFPTFTIFLSWSKIYFISDDFPDPDTPVIQVNIPNGILIFRLLIL